MSIPILIHISCPCDNFGFDDSLRSRRSRRRSRKQAGTTLFLTCLFSILQTLFNSRLCMQVHEHRHGCWVQACHNRRTQRDEMTLQSCAESRGASSYMPLSLCTELSPGLLKLAVSGGVNSPSVTTLHPQVPRTCWGQDVPDSDVNACAWPDLST